MVATGPRPQLPLAWREEPPAPGCPKCGGAYHVYKSELTFMFDDARVARARWCECNNDHCRHRFGRYTYPTSTPANP